MTQGNALAQRLIPPSVAGNSLKLVAFYRYRAMLHPSSNIDVTFPDLSSVAGLPIASVLPRGRMYLESFRESWTGAIPDFTPGRIYRRATSTQDIVF